MVKPGYKQTEIGVLPEDWIVRRLSECTKRVGVGLATSVTQYYREDGVPIFRNLNIKPGYLDDSDILYLDPDFANRQESKKICTGDVLTVHTGYVGISCVVPAKYNNALTFTTLITTTDSNLLLPEFLSLYLNSSFGALEIESLQAGGGRNNLNVNDFVNFRIPLPLISEQRKIIEYLKEIDRYLEFTDRQLSKKKAIKQGAMQELLTGKKRLPGFSGEWKSYKLRDLGEFLKGSGISRAESNTGKIPAVRYGELYTHHHNYVVDYISRISKDVAAKAKQVYKGDILFAASGETKEEIGKCAAIFSQETIYAGGDILIFRPSVYLNPIFMGTLLNTADVCRQRAEKGQGDAVVHIHADSLGSIKIRIPENSEQDAIADILFDMDKEIKLLEQKLEKYRQVKRGMMQQLLTGKIRLV